jgi:hypothetical protein
MAGTVKSCVPDAVLPEELVVCGEAVACRELVGRAEADAVTEEWAAAECRCVGEAEGDAPGVPVSADVGDAPGVVARAVADPLAGGTEEAAEGFDVLPPHAVKPTPPMTAAMITAETRLVLMFRPPLVITYTHKVT